MAEVERIVSQCPDVEKVVVLHHVLSEIASVLVAYYTTGETGDLHKSRDLDDDDDDVKANIRQRCAMSLPDYMQPQIIHVGDIPVQLHTGKIDRRELETVYRQNIKRLGSIELASLNSAEKKVG